MDVSLWKSRIFLSAISFFFLISCGNRFDLSTERGRQARIDDANYHLSRQQCDEALAAINPLYGSAYVDDEVRIITSSAYACKGGLNILTLVSSFSGAANYFTAIASSLNNSADDLKRSYMYAAMDVLTQSGTKINASQRSADVNTYMVFIQIGILGVIIRNYGNPSSTGAQQTNLIYNAVAGTQAGEMSDTDACALAAAASIFSDSFPASNLTDADIRTFSNTMNATCTSAGLASCSVINKDRTLCNGVNQQTIDASAVVGAINASW